MDKRGVRLTIGSAPSPTFDDHFRQDLDSMIYIYGNEMFYRGRTRGRYDKDWDKVEDNL
jgi:hypothetical protein